MAIEEKILPGLVLLADPFLTDPNFKRTVILLSEIQDKGFVGFILNRRLNLNLGDAIPELQSVDSPLYYGGPVQTDTMHFFHKMGNKIKGSIEIVDGIFWGGDFDQVKEMLLDGSAEAEDFRFYLGYAGWDKEQLVKELKDKSWMLEKGTFSHVFAESNEGLWKYILNKKGGKYAIISGFPEDPLLN